MKLPNHLYLVIAMLFFLCLNSCHLITAARSNGKEAAPPELEERLSKIRLTDLNNRSYGLQELVGQPIFLNFWATWCAPCIAEMGTIAYLHQKYGERMVFLAVSTENLEKIQRFKEERPFSFDYARLDIDYIDAYVIKLPTTLLINRKGEVVHEEEGSRDWSSRESEDKVRAALE